MVHGDHLWWKDKKKRDITPNCSPRKQYLMMPLIFRQNNPLHNKSILIALLYLDIFKYYICITIHIRLKSLIINHNLPTPIPPFTPKTNWLINCMLFCTLSGYFTNTRKLPLSTKGWNNYLLVYALITTTFEHGGIFIVPYLLKHGASVFTVSSEWSPTLVASYNEPVSTCTGDISDPHPYGIPSQIEHWNPAKQIYIKLV